MGFLAASATFISAAAHAQKDGSALSDQEKNDINSRLIIDAQLQFNVMSKFAETSYSRTLDSLETALNAQIRQKYPGLDWGIVVVDQQKVDFGLALGFGTRGILRQLNDTPYDVSDHVVTYGNINIGDAYYSDYGTRGFWLKPGTSRNVHTPDPGAVFVFPGSFHTVTRIYEVPGLTLLQNLEFTYRHEGVHGVDNRYLGQPEGDDMAEFVSIYKSEVYADVAALGQMIRKGEDVGLINAVAAWRASNLQSNPSDREHLSTPVLRAFKNYIRKLGVETFRALSDDQADAVYADMVETYGMTAESFRILDTYESMLKGENGTDHDDIQKIVQMARHDKNAKKALEFNSFFNNSALKIPEKKQNVPPATVNHILSAWDPLKELQDLAFAEAHKITPASITKAYGLMHEKFIAQIRKDPERSDLYQEQMTYLQRVYITNLKSMDYADLNIRYGVPVTDIRSHL